MTIATKLAGTAHTVLSDNAFSREPTLPRKPAARMKTPSRLHDRESLARG
jgi:hypothetical protein